MKNTRSRREFLSDLSRVIGATTATSLLTPNAISVAMAFSPAPGDITKAGKIFTREELTCLKHICATVIPRTQTPSAADVDTHGFIDNQLYHCYAKEKQQEVRASLALVEQQAVKRHGKTFAGLTATQQHALLTDLDSAQQEFTPEQQQKFKALKALICFGFYTSEAGASQELRYQAIPGGFKGSIPYKPTDKSWGSLGLSY
ncbi:gluconate 2-dehydrogenase subunit 3 family protein [Thalassomonas viridans]|uniref:Gluconate 2-dehydrogenase subunit 3 family protein n=1 Tax=Thalassomonas viridans TaxID=137584 RepID=A0AAE9Z030_9GAMM|nr:gluconate 2-dehydrogenase subunit 3 family protein [Thalassomonas viridans]WDE03620.1 gluconate 2-dehydrogenase subunit 3 family protein [Thalassomonas viridans]